MIQGISVAAQTTSFDAMAQHQQELAAAILKDPDVVSLSSFIGVDGSNTDAEQRPLPDQPEAEGRSQPERDRDRPPPAAGDRRGRRRLAVSAAGAGSDDRRRGQPHAVPVRAGEPELCRVQRVGAETAGSGWQQSARSDQCRQRSAATGADGEPGDRPGDRGALRHHAGDGGQRAVRPVRSAHHLHHLHAVQPVPRHHGGGSGAADTRWMR